MPAAAATAMMLRAPRLRPARAPASGGAAAAWRLPAAPGEGQQGHTAGPAGGAASSTLKAQRRWLKRQKVLKREPPTPGARADDIVELNVGGRAFVTHRSTLLQAPLLASMLGSPEAEAALPHDSEGRVFLDLDPDAFRAVLKFLRELKLAGGRGVVPLPEARGDGAYVRQLLAHLGLGARAAAAAAAAASAAAAPGPRWASSWRT